MEGKTPEATVLMANACVQKVFFWNTKAGVLSMAVTPRVRLKGPSKMNLLVLKAGQRLPGYS